MAGCQICTGRARRHFRGGCGTWLRSMGIAALAAFALLPTGFAARAQSLNDLSGALGGLGGGLPSVDQASPGNIAGVLQYCVRNNYLGGADKAMGSSVLGKLGGSGEGAEDSGFTAGSKGLLETGGGDTFGLGGGGIQEKITDQVCDLVLKHAQSIL